MKIREGLFWCRCADRAIFLDTVQDRYFCLSPRLQGAFDAWLALDDTNDAGLRLLIHSGILTCDDQVADSGADIRANIGGNSSAIAGPHSDTIPDAHSGAIFIQPAISDCGQLSPDASGAICASGLIDAASAAISECRARAILRHQPLAQVLAGLRPMKRAAAPEQTAERLARRIAAAFAATGRWLGSADKCLPRAVAAWRKCDRAGLEAVLVFGVRTDPFAAHCWVQLDGAVIVGDLEQVRMFTPILAVPCDRATS